MAIVRARRRRLKLRLGIAGPSKRGKTYSALSIGRGLIEALSEMGELEGNGRILVVDTEHGKSDIYALRDDDDDDRSRFDFDLEEFTPPYAPEDYIRKLRLAERENYSVVIFDQISHEWTGQGGSLQIHQSITKEKGIKTSYMNWGDVKSRHAAWIEAMLASPCHVICTMRAKVKHRVTKGGNGEAGGIEKIGVKPIAEGNIEYEFDAYGMMDLKNGVTPTLKFDNSRIPEVSLQEFPKPGDELGKIFAQVLVYGKATQVAETTGLDERATSSILAYAKELGIGPEHLIEYLTPYGVSKIRDLAARDAASLETYLRQEVLKKKTVARNALVNAGTPVAAPVVQTPPPKPTPPLPAPEPEPEPEPEAAESAAEEEVPADAVVLDVYWYADPNGGDTVDVTHEQVQSLLAEGLDPDAVCLMRQDESEWRSAADYGFVVPGEAYEPTGEEVAEELMEEFEATAEGEPRRIFDLESAEGRAEAEGYVVELAGMLGYTVPSGDWTTILRRHGAVRGKINSVTNERLDELIEYLVEQLKQARESQAAS